MEWQLITLSVVRTLSAACAGILTVFAYRAYRRTASTPLRWLALASFLLVVGFLAAGIIYQATGNLLQATVLEAPFTLAALLLMMASLFGRNFAAARPLARAGDEPTPRDA